ncbi:MAG TPA: hypothetical protein VFA33_11840 [Bryobacteraceae bacterium]|nr:hypothetical protein [Bryobacteraceae bacterium]
MTNTPDTSQGLAIKAYFAGSVEAAMDQALRELGPEALLVNSRRAPQEARHLGEYEVVFATSPAPAAAELRVDGAGNAAEEAWESVSRELRDLREQLRRMRDAMAGMRGPHRKAELDEWLQVLTGADVEPELAREIVEGVWTAFPAKAAVEIRSGSITSCRDAEGGGEEVHQLLAAELERRLAVAPELKPEEDRTRVAALVGPPGAGKTTTLVKLAVNYGLTAHRPVHLISMDGWRVGGAEQLRSYAAILGVGFQAVETTRSLEQSLAEHRGKGLILIDTPGFSPSTMPEAKDLARGLCQRADIDTHLVLPASMRYRDMLRALHEFEVFRPAKLLFTRLDETDAWGAVFCAAVRSGKPLSFLACGPIIPEDIEPASKSRVAAEILRQPKCRAGCAV